MRANSGLLIGTAGLGCLAASIWTMSWGLMIAGILLVGAAYQAKW